MEIDDMDSRVARTFSQHLTSVAGFVDNWPGPPFFSHSTELREINNAKKRVRRAGEGFHNDKWREQWESGFRRRDLGRRRAVPPGRCRRCYYCKVREVGSVQRHDSAVKDPIQHHSGHCPSLAAARHLPPCLASPLLTRSASRCTTRYPSPPPARPSQSQSRTSLASQRAQRMSSTRENTRS